MFIFFNFLILYSFLVISDYLYFRVSSKEYIEDRKIAGEWFIDHVQDKMEQAKKEGYEGFFYPYLFDNKNQLSRIAKKNKIIPLGGQPNTNVFLCDEGYGLIKFKTDKFGFRNSNDAWLDKKLNNSLIIIGDSLAAGHCLQDRDTFADKINKNIPVINLSSGGNNSPIYYAISKSLIKKIKPKKVLIVFAQNDNSLLSSKSINELKKSYFLNNDFIENFLLKTNNRITLNPKIDKFFNDVRAILDQNQTDNFFTKSYRGRKNVFSRAMRYFSLPTLRNKFKIIWNNIFFKFPYFSILAIDEANKQCKLHGCELIISYIPTDSDQRPDIYLGKFKEKIKKYSLENDIKFYDFADYIINSKKNHKDYFTKKGGHFTKFGAEEFSKNFIKLYLKH